LVMIKFLAFLLIGTTLAMADGGPPIPNRPKLVAHNGSIMEVREVGPNEIVILYKQPRQRMLEEGVIPGTLLIRGKWVGKNEFVGEARVFSGWCRQAYPYEVRGGLLFGNGFLILKGPSPDVDLNTCQVLGYSWGPNSQLTFSFLGE